MEIFLIVGIIAIIVIAIIIAITAMTEKDNKSNNKSNFNSYKKVNSILSEAEFNFFNILRLALNNSDFIICPKVRIADFVKVTRTDNWQRDFNRISSKHIDFLVCNNKLSPILAIELDDKSHNNTKERDNFVNELYKSINLPILRVKNGYTYSVVELKENIKNLIK